MTAQSNEKLRNNVSLPEMEEYAKGRILPKFVAEVVGSTKKTLQQKCDNILLTTNTWNFIKQNRSIIGPITEAINGKFGYKISGSKMFVDNCHNYICCIPDGIQQQFDIGYIVYQMKDLFFRSFG